MQINKLLVEKRKEFKISQENLAEKLGVSRQTIGKWESGKCYPKFSHIAKIYNYFNLPLANLEEIVTTQKKELTIGATKNIHDYKLPKYLLEFCFRYPETEINVITDTTEKLSEFLMAHKIDVLMNYQGNTSCTNKYEFITQPVGDFNTCFACSKKFYQEECYKVEKLNDLNNYTLVISGKSRRRLELDKTLKENNVVLKPQIRMHDSKGMIDFVLGGKYIGYFIDEQVENTELVKLKIKEKLRPNPIVIIYSNDANNIVKQFVEIVLETEKIIGTN